MKKMTIAIPVLAVTLLTGGFLVSSHAQQNGMSNAQVETKETYTEAQLQDARKAREVSQEKSLSLRQELFVKKEELRALQNAATPDVAAVSKKATEITQVQNKLMDEKKSLGMALDKALGLAPGTHGNRFMHGGYGQNHHRAERCGRGYDRGRHGRDYDGHRKGHGRRGDHDQDRRHDGQHRM